MTASDYSALASAISALCALFTIYMYRSQGKGFVWTKDHKIELITDGEGRIHLQVSIPLYNFGKGRIRFLNLKVKKINLKTKQMDNFDLEMHEAHFTEGALILAYNVPIHTELVTEEKNQLMLVRSQFQDMVPQQLKEFQEKINKKLEQVPEHILILKTKYKDGSWFGNKTKETVIGLSVTGQNINYLSSARRKELNEYFAW